MNGQRMAKLLTILCFLFPVLLLILIWLPELRHTQVSSAKITIAVLNQGQNQPSDVLLAEIRTHRLLTRYWESDQQLVRTAEKLLRGRAEVPGYEPINIRLPFDATDLDRGSSLWQLQLAGLIVPEIFLDAYELTGREEFYVSARDVIFAWSNYDRRAWLNRGFLWNDHAVAARIRTLADFWRVYRRRADYRPEVAVKIWEFVSRTGEMLAKQDQFTFSTNHGIMQNLALWQICLAFPSLPRAENYQQVALARLTKQLAFLVAPDGAVLEHSAYYDEFGVYLLGLALRYASLLQLQIPPEWSQKYGAAKEFYAQIRRPDGSLPIFGDTENVKDKTDIAVPVLDSDGTAGPLTRGTEWKPTNSFGLFPVSGYAVVWEGLDRWPILPDLSQAVVTWSYYAGHGHKHADEMGILFWAGGQDWWTNAGYWPYDDPDRTHAECWEGSNAPHLADEACNSERSTSLTSYLPSPELSAVELERRGPGDFAARRLVVHVPPDVWIVADASSGGIQKTLETVWTADPEIDVQRQTQAGEFILHAAKLPMLLRAHFFGPSAMRISKRHASRSPFAGWVSRAGKPQPTEAILTEQNADGGWALSVWAIEDAPGALGDSRRPFASNVFGNFENWELSLHAVTGDETISRQGDVLSIHSSKTGHSKTVRAPLRPAPLELASGIATIRSGYLRAAAEYPRFHELSLYRVRASVFCIVFWLISELLVFFFKRPALQYQLIVRAAALLCWVGLAFWTELSYLKTFF
jgi:hypothetical protein